MAEIRGPHLVLGGVPVTSVGATAPTDKVAGTLWLDTGAAAISPQPLSSDLTAIAALTPSNDDLLQRKSGVWVNRTLAQVRADLIPTVTAPLTFSGGALAVPAAAAPSTDGYLQGSYKQRLDYRTAVVLYHIDSRVIYLAGQPVNPVLDAAQQHGFYAYQFNPSTGTGAALNDSFMQAFEIEAGTYTLTVLGITNTSFGQVGWKLDGSTIGTTQDWYSASLAYNVTKTISGIVIATSGTHYLQGTTTGKNASSSGYSIPLTKFSLA